MKRYKILLTVIEEILSPERQARDHINRNMRHKAQVKKETPDRPDREPNEPRNPGADMKPTRSQRPEEEASKSGSGRERQQGR